ncbi:hypothetical protein R1flu_015357 [Riccia fluitans]|uniref:Uncharacterized protein n=1 Tax=Riccia fluitans TaxID=41844 RepID=A0ABD1YIR4_9MARC
MERGSGPAENCPQASRGEREATMRSWGFRPPWLSSSSPQVLLQGVRDRLPPLRRRDISGPGKSGAISFTAGRRGHLVAQVNLLGWLEAISIDPHIGDVEAMRSLHLCSFCSLRCR